MIYSKPDKCLLLSVLPRDVSVLGAVVGAGRTAGGPGMTDCIRRREANDAHADDRTAMTAERALELRRMREIVR